MLKHMGAYTVARLTILRLFKKVKIQILSTSFACMNVRQS